ncbi:C4-dicarboxylate TRAP transporter substrate-binding protein [Geomicrobium sediminis]|uniref:Tripartite ATP-independent transporter DctP family solute receptor n=1 Tax=Geomicrobium sediminis TaxID=1347788 RepID=A0ABS2PF04_9BACL|nr:C4-dicarboxylate TRAP transporter substrate-binding protein [Geomicrobium sediminis]MBM7633403.1 tripartite ATP-independent transporter DctP family solute receptor [Geomicrobium sediminis]
MRRGLVSVLGAMLLIGSGCSLSTSAAVEQDVHTINIAYGNQPGEPLDQQAHKWAELAEEESDGRLQLNVYPSSQLGGESDMIELAMRGNNVIVFTAYDFLMDYVPDLGILAAPYLAEEFDDLLYLTTTDWYADLENDMNDMGLALLGKETIYGERHLMTKTPVTTPEDLQGMKIRVPNNNLYIRAFHALGASPTPLPLGDLYASLQQGVIDGAENPLPVLQGTRTNEVTNHLTLTGHMKVMSIWVTGTGMMDDLPEDLERILTETSEEAARYTHEITEREEKEALETFKNEGMTIHEVDQELFREAVEPFYDSMPAWSPGLYEHVLELMEERPKED